eukprot:TRINITY_DN6599_c0_g2_i1.p1 TRINITY_DN6599_c0_g2~~TRINITY_DN6599_c0_g2_i1.p1  ORF type:complete len:179 (+),score=26.34 TRINITY_DN6599_c0_g2_i1:247-783(+)
MIHSQKVAFTFSKIGPRIFSRGFAVGNKVQEGLTLTHIDGSKFKVSEGLKDKKIVVVGLPGAFSNICTNQHVPAFIKDSDKIKAKGITDIWIVSVNDHYVMKAWSLTFPTVGKVKFMADPNGSFTKSLGLDYMSEVFGGIRSKRYSMIIDNGTIITENVEESTGNCDVSNTLNLLKQL